jgi:hypothetical protein
MRVNAMLPRRNDADKSNLPWWLPPETTRAIRRAVEEHGRVAQTIADALKVRTGRVPTAPPTAPPIPATAPPPTPPTPPTSAVPMTSTTAPPTPAPSSMPTADPGPATPPSDPRARRKGVRGANIDARMLKVLSERPESLGWSCRQWAECLGCACSTVAGTTTWKIRIPQVRSLHQAERIRRGSRR